ncbi:MAG TPA: hypothetical protein VNG29_03205 [Candidatus Paceibacterota bacterium]|nr:hypothetical protein [Candidatus Paceibacterota bacterium]
MKNKIAAYTCFLLLCLAPVSFGQAKKKSLANRFSVEFSYGTYRVPGLILGMDKSITAHPNGLGGTSFGARLGFAATKRWSFGVQFVDMSAAGKGPWARGDEAAIDGVTGAATGKTDWTVRGVMFDAGQTFRPNGRVHPYWRAGGGIGFLTVKFGGEFHGCATEDIGCNFPIDEPAADRVARKIPLFGGEGGVIFDISKHFGFTTAGYWNTGWGVKAGIRITF